MKFRKKPVVIEAEQYLGPEFVRDPEVPPAVPPGVGWMPTTTVGARGGAWVVLVPVIETLEGRMRVTPGDWIITGIQGERYPCKPDIFEATYEPVDNP